MGTNGGQIRFIWGTCVFTTFNKKQHNTPEKLYKSTFLLVSVRFRPDR